MVFVIKADGRKEEFSRQKIVLTCTKMHAQPQVAEEIASKIEREVYNGIKTKQILDKIFSYLKSHKPEVKIGIDLREAIAKLKSKPDFEHFVAELLRDYGYKVVMNQIVRGKCIEHEIDNIAMKGNETLFVEVKHHEQYHSFTGLDVFLQNKAAFDDLKEGYSEGKNRFNFTKPIVVTNTKISEHARKYAECRGIDFVGWKSSEEKGLERMIEDKRLYPVTILKNLDNRISEKFSSMNIVSLKHLLSWNSKELSKKIGVSSEKMEEIFLKARQIYENF